jgi:hypothetical protein
MHFSMILFVSYAFKLFYASSPETQRNKKLLCLIKLVCRVGGANSNNGTLSTQDQARYHS